MKDFYKELEDKNFPIIGQWRTFLVSVCEELGGDFEVLHGMVCFDEGKVHLAQLGDDESKLDTFLHELLHIVLDGASLGAEYEKKGVLPGLSNEELTQRITPSLLHFLRNNKEMMTWFISKL